MMKARWTLGKTIGGEQDKGRGGQQRKEDSDKSQNQADPAWSHHDKSKRSRLESHWSITLLCFTKGLLLWNVSAKLDWRLNCHRKNQGQQLGVRLEFYLESAPYWIEMKILAILLILPRIFSTDWHLSWEGIGYPLNRGGSQLGSWFFSKPLV